MVKRRRRQYPARSAFSGTINKKLIGRIIMIAALAAVVYYGYPYVTGLFESSADETAGVAVEAGDAGEDVKPESSRPAAAQSAEISPQTPQLAAASIQIEVLNGTRVAGLASRITDSLRTRGFDVVKTGNFESKNVSETLVILRSTKKGAAQMVADYLGIKNVVAQTAPDLMLDVTVVLGQDHRKLKVFQ